MSPPNLGSLPLDVSYSILSYLYQGPHSKEHPYLTLSAVSKHLNGLIEAYTAHIIATRLTLWPISKPGGVLAKKSSNRQRLLRHVWKHCEFCNKKSSRRAILAPHLQCCKVCDMKEWEEKITMTEACKKYHLKQQDLFDSNIRYGTYYGVTGLTTLFLEPDVYKLATKIHAGVNGNLAAFLALRTSQSLERKAKREKGREAKKAHLGHVLIANGLTQPNLATSLAPLLLAGNDKRPALSALEIVRMKLLEQRLERENPSAQTRFNILHHSYNKELFELFYKEFNLPNDNIEFLKGEGEVEAERYNGMRRWFYENQRSRWGTTLSHRDSLWARKQFIIAPNHRDPWEKVIATQNEPPWSWTYYPILVKDVAMEDLEPTTTGAAVPEDPKKAAEKQKELKRVNRWNAGAEKEMARITALINERGLNKGLWHPKAPIGVGSRSAPGFGGSLGK